jgi:hypothetical protein
LADSDVYGDLARAVVQQDARSAIEMVAALSAQGVDLRRFVAEGIAFYRGVFLAHYSPNLAEVADEPEDVLAEWRQVAQELPAPDVLRVVDHLAEALLRLREGREERLMVEITLLKLTQPQTAGDPASLLARIDQLEQKVRRLGTVSPVTPRPVAVVPEEKPGAVGEAETAGAEEPIRPESTVEHEEPAAVEEEPVQVPVTQVPPAGPISGLTIGQFESVWPALVAGVRDDLGPRRQALFREASPGSVDGSTVTLFLPDHLSFHLEQLQDDDLVRQVVEARAAELLGGSVRVRFRTGSGSDAPPAQEDVVPNKDQLLEAPGSANDPDALVEGLLGGQVIEEIMDDD